jgi:rhomboid family GlyGly-CTERM serine protease
MIDAVRSQAAGRYSAPPRLVGALPASLALALPALLLALWPGAAARFEYDRVALASGELWRAITGHWTHWSVDHLVWDLAAFALLVWIGWRKGPRRLLLTLAASAVSISVAIWFVAGEITRYRGLSGIDSALFTFVALTVLKEELEHGRRGTAAAVALVLAGFAVKIVFELTTGATLFTDSSEFVPLPLAHVVGGICGGLGAWVTSRPGCSSDPRRPTRLAACVGAAVSRGPEGPPEDLRARPDGRWRSR